MSILIGGNRVRLAFLLLARMTKPGSTPGFG